MWSHTSMSTRVGTHSARIGRPCGKNAFVSILLLPIQKNDDLECVTCYALGRGRVGFIPHGHRRQTSARDPGAAQRSCTTRRRFPTNRCAECSAYMTTSSAVHRPWRIRPRRRTGQGLATGATIYYLQKNAFGSDTNTLILIQSIYVSLSA